MLNLFSIEDSFGAIEVCQKSALWRFDNRFECEIIEEMEILISATDSKIKSFSSELSSDSLVYFYSARFSAFLRWAMMAALRSTQIWSKKLKLYSF